MSEVGAAVSEGNLMQEIRGGDIGLISSVGGHRR